MSIKDLGYAAVGATLYAIFPAYAKRLKRDAILQYLAKHQKAREQETQWCKDKGEALDQCAEITTKVRERCNHKKGGTLGRLVDKAWHLNGWDPGDNFVDNKFVPQHHLGSTGNGLSRWEGEWRGVNTYITGKGDGSQYAVTKHQFANGDIHVRCMRCGKNWKPGDEDYDTALNFPTLNVSSTSAQWGARQTETWEVASRRPELWQEKEFQKKYKAALGNRF